MPAHVTVDPQAQSSPNRSVVAEKPGATAPSAQQRQQQCSRKSSSAQQQQQQRLCADSLSKSSSATVNSLNLVPAQMSVVLDSTVGGGSGSTNNNNNERPEARYAQQMASNTQPQLRRIVDGTHAAGDAPPVGVTSNGSASAGLASHTLGSASRETHAARNGRSSISSTSSDAKAARHGTSSSLSPGRAGAAARSPATVIVENAVVSLTEDNRGFLNPEYAKDLSSSSDDDDADHDTDGGSYESADPFSASACVRAPSLAIFPLTEGERHAVRVAYEACAAANAAGPHRGNMVQLLRELHATAYPRPGEVAARAARDVLSPPATELLAAAETSLGTLRFREVMSGCAGSNGNCDTAAAAAAVVPFTLEDALRFVGVLKFGRASHLFTDKKKDKLDAVTSPTTTATTTTATTTTTTTTSSSPGGEKGTPAATPSNVLSPVSALLPATESTLPATFGTTTAAPAPPSQPPPFFSPSPGMISFSSVLTASPIAFTATSTTNLMRPGTRPPTATPSGNTPGEAHRPLVFSSTPAPTSPSGADAAQQQQQQQQQQSTAVRGGAVTPHAPPRRRRRRSSTPPPSTSSTLCRDAAVRAYVERKAFAELTEGCRGARRRVSLDRLVEALRLFELALNPPAVASVCGGVQLDALGAFAAGAQVDYAAFVRIMEAGLHHPLDGTHHHSHHPHQKPAGHSSGQRATKEGHPNTSATSLPMFVLDLQGDAGAAAAATAATSHASPSTMGRSSGAASRLSTNNSSGGGGGAASLRDSFLSSKSVLSAASPGPQRGVSRSHSNSSLAASVASLTKSSSDTDDPYPVIVAQDSAMAALCREVRWRLRTAAHRSASESAELAAATAATGHCGEAGGVAGGTSSALPPPPPPLPAGVAGTAPPSSSMPPLPAASLSVSPVSSSSSRAEGRRRGPPPPPLPAHIDRSSASPNVRRPLDTSRHASRGRHDRGGAGRRTAAAAAPSEPPRRPHPAECPFTLSSTRSAESLQRWRREMVPPPSSGQWTAPHPYGPASLESTPVATHQTTTTTSSQSTMLAPRTVSRGPREPRRRNSNSICSSSNRSVPLLRTRPQSRSTHGLRRPTMPFNALGGAAAVSAQGVRQRPEYYAAAQLTSTTSTTTTTTTTTTTGAIAPQPNNAAGSAGLMLTPGSSRPPRRRPPRWEQITALSPYYAPPPRHQRLTGVYAHLGGTTHTPWRTTTHPVEAETTSQHPRQQDTHPSHTSSNNMTPPQAPLTCTTTALRPSSPVVVHPRRPTSAASSLRSSRPSLTVGLSTSSVMAAELNAAAAAAAVAAGSPYRPMLRQSRLPSTIVAVLAPSPPSSPLPPPPAHPSRGLLVRPQRPSLAHPHEQRQQHHTTRFRGAPEHSHRGEHGGDYGHPYAGHNDVADGAVTTMRGRGHAAVSVTTPQTSSAVSTGAASAPAAGLPFIPVQRLRREWLLSELAELHLEHKTLTQRLAALSTLAAQPPTLQVSGGHHRYQHPDTLSRQARLEEATECEAALNVVSRRIHRHLAELAVDGPASEESHAPSGVVETRAQARVEEETRQREEHLAYTIAEACEAAVSAAQTVVRASIAPASQPSTSPPPPPTSPPSQPQRASTGGENIVSQSNRPAAAAPPASEAGLSTAESVSCQSREEGTVDQQGEETQEGRRSVDPTTATSARENSGCSGPADFGGQPSDDDGHPHFTLETASASPSQDSLHASTVPNAADSAHSRLTQRPWQRPHLPATLSVNDSSTRTALTEPLSVPDIYRIGQSLNTCHSPKLYMASETDVQEADRSARDPSSTCEVAKSSRTSTVASAVITAAAAATTTTTTTTTTVILSSAPSSTPHASSTEDRKSASTALSGHTTASSVALPPLRVSPYSPPMMRPRASSSSTTGTATTTSMSSAAAAFGLHGSASTITTGTSGISAAPPPAPHTTAAAMEAAGGMYDDDSPSPRANFYLEWAVTQLEQRQRLQQRTNGGGDYPAAHTSGTTGSFTARLKSALLPHASGSSLYNTQLQAPSSGPATGATTTATTNSSWTTSRVLSTPGMFARPPTGANRSTASSGRALHNSLNASKPGSANSENGLASILTERHSHSLPAPLAGENDTMRSDDRPPQERGSMTTLTDEAALLGYSAGDRTAMLRRSLAAAGASRSHAGLASHMTNASLGSNSTLQASAISAPLEFMGSTTWNMSGRSRVGVGAALRSGHGSAMYRMARSTARPYGGGDNQRSYSTFERTVSSILPAGFSGSMFPQRDADGNIIPEDDG